MLLAHQLDVAPVSPGCIALLSLQCEGARHYFLALHRCGGCPRLSTINLQPDFVTNMECGRGLVEYYGCSTFHSTASLCIMCLDLFQVRPHWLKALFRTGSVVRISRPISSLAGLSFVGSVGLNGNSTVPGGGRPVSKSILQSSQLVRPCRWTVEMGT